MIVKTWPYKKHRHSGNLELFFEEKLGFSEKASERICLPYHYWCQMLNFIEGLILPSNDKNFVKLAKYDTWNMDNTLAYIIVPMLEQLQKTKVGSPLVDDEDVPEHLRSTNSDPKKADGNCDELFHKRWEWVIEEMIWVFTEIRDGAYEEYLYDTYPLSRKILDDGKITVETSEETNYKTLREALSALNSRLENGTKLFGKYYRALWD